MSNTLKVLKRFLSLAFFNYDDIIIGAWLTPLVLAYEMDRLIDRFQFLLDY